MGFCSHKFRPLIAILSTCFASYLFMYVIYFQQFNRRVINLSDVDFNEEICPERSCNFSRRLLSCMDSWVLSLLSNISFTGHPLLPMDLELAQCILRGRKSNVVRKIATFGLFASPNPKLVLSVMKVVVFQKTLCDTVVANDDCLMIKCQDLYLRIVRLNDKKDFWQGRLYNVALSNSKKPEHNVAFKKMNLQEVNFKEIIFKYPLDYTLYQDHLLRSRLVECNRSILGGLKEKYPAYYNVTPKLNKANFEWFVKFRDLLHGIRITPILACGTLLGWVRECGIIPYTHDFDLMMLAEEYNDHFEQRVLNDKNFKLAFRFNQLNESLEYSVRDPTRVKIDLFVLYPESNYTWFGGVGMKRTKLKFSFPPLKGICAADFMGFLFHVPCNFVEVLVADFGPDWQTPVHQKQFMSKLFNQSKSLSIVKTMSIKEYDDIVVRF